MSDDPFFRYKMPKITVKHEGKGNGVKTVLTNLKDIAKALDREPEDLLQYISAELSVASVHRNDDQIVNGTFPAGRVQDVVSKFVNSHVLCDICSNPETKFQYKGKAKKDPIMYKVCMACGGKSKLKDHKINKRIKATPLEAEK